MDNLISVIVPAYNVAPWLPRCLDSILVQSYKNLEIIVIDDGATDETSRIIDEYAEKDSRIRAIHQENMGLVGAREKGIEIASGEWIGFVDGDDAIAPDMYEKLLKNALKYNADISHCGICFCFSDGRKDYHYETGRIKQQSNYEGLKDLLEGKFIEPGLCNKLYRSTLLMDSCLDKTVLNNEDLLRNFILFERSQKSIYEDFCGYQYYQRENSISKNKNKLLQIERHIITARRLIVEHSTEDIYPFAMRTWLGSIVNAINALMDDDNLEVQQYCQYCREILKKERRHFQYMIRRQQWAAKLILFSMESYKVVYRVYKYERFK